MVPDGFTIASGGLVESVSISDDALAKPRLSLHVKSGATLALVERSASHGFCPKRAWATMSAPSREIAGVTCA